MVVSEEGEPSPAQEGAAAPLSDDATGLRQLGAARATTSVQWQAARAQTLWEGPSATAGVWGDGRSAPVPGLLSGGLRERGWQLEAEWGREEKHVSWACHPKSPCLGYCQLHEGRGHFYSLHCIVKFLAPCSAELWRPGYIC